MLENDRKGEFAGVMKIKEEEEAQERFTGQCREGLFPIEVLAHMSENQHQEMLEENLPGLFKDVP